MRFDPARDAEAMKTALLELMEEGFALSLVEDRLEGMPEELRQRELEKLPARTLTPGFYRIAEYLLWLSAYIEANVPAPAKMLSFEALGLKVLADARHKFEHNHPPCGGCGALQDTRFALGCYACGMEFKRIA